MDTKDFIFAQYPPTPITGIDLHVPCFPGVFCTYPPPAGASTSAGGPDARPRRYSGPGRCGTGPTATSVTLSPLRTWERHSVSRHIIALCLFVQPQSLLGMPSTVGTSIYKKINKNAQSYFVTMVTFTSLCWLIVGRFVPFDVCIPTNCYCFSCF